MKAFVLFAVLLGLAVPGFGEAVEAGPSLKEQLKKRSLGTVVFEKVAFERASFDEAMTLFEKLYDKEVKGEIKLQWVYKGFERKTMVSTVTISGKEMSAGKMLQEMTRQCGLTAKLDEHAIVLSVKEEEKVAAAKVEPERAEPEKVEKKEERKSRLGTGSGLRSGSLRD